MSFQHSIQQRWNGNGQTETQTNTYTGTGQISIDESVADSSTDFLITGTLDVSAVQALYINSTQNVTLETNSGSAPADTISLKANVPYIWTTDSYDAMKLATDVTAFYVTNASGSAAQLRIEALTDATP